MHGVFERSPPFRAALIMDLGVHAMFERSPPFRAALIMDLGVHGMFERSPPFGNCMLRILDVAQMPRPVKKSSQVGGTSPEILFISMVRPESMKPVTCQEKSGYERCGIQI